MVGCLIFGTIISSFSIFAFFGNAFSNTGGSAIPNMFQLMFGTGGTYSGYYITWKSYGGMIALFVIQIINILVSLITWYICTKDNNNSQKVACGVFSILLSVTNTILSFCTIPMTGISSSFGVRLGAGPIIYSVLNIVSILVILVGIVGTFGKYSFNKGYVPSSEYKALKESKENNKRGDISEEERIDLISKYKSLLDSGAITQEEYDVKKKEILDRNTVPSKKGSVIPTNEEIDYEDLLKYKQMFEAGEITQEEYNEIRKKCNDQ